MKRSLLAVLLLLGCSERTLVAGDSIPFAYAQHFHPIVNAENLAVPGSTTWHWFLGPFGNPGYVLLTGALISGNAEWCITQVGTNDLPSLNITPLQHQGFYQRMLDDWLAAGCENVLSVQPPLVLDPNQPERAAWLGEARPLQQEACEATADCFLGPDLSVVLDPNAHYMADGIHLNTPGERAAIHAIQDALMRAEGGYPTEPLGTWRTP